jgi:hypothetical protein
VGILKRTYERVSNGTEPKATIPKPRRMTPGPKPEMFKIKVDWKETVKQSLTKKKLQNGWPK